MRRLQLYALIFSPHLRLAGTEKSMSCGAGVFTSPTAVELDVLDKYGVAVVGRTEEISERFYAIFAERRIKHPAVSVIIQAARTELFG